MQRTEPQDVEMTVPHTAISQQPRPARRFTTLTRQLRWHHARQAALVVMIIASVIATMSWWLLTATATNYPGSHFNNGQNAVWLAHTWVGDAHTSADYDQLASRLQREQMAYVYVHVGPLDGDGGIPQSRYPHASEFAQEMHDRLPSLRILAWMGQIYRAGAQPGEDVVDLNLPDTRAHIVTMAGIFVNDLHFDGVHYDIEPIPNNDNHFLDLLDETREAIGSTHTISIATPNWVPIARVTDIVHAISDRPDVWWTTYYYQKISQHVDQIVTMMYNTGMPTAPLYEAIVQQETAHILRSIANASPTTHVIVGIPAFEDPSSRAFHASAENMESGLRGVIAGLNYDEVHPAFAGIAVYPEWETTEDEWAIYDKLWLGRS